ncbi:ParA family protein [Micromonospora sp. DSM 115977]|uniref:ParA family protein n=1 Tax=Micromonospora reichwaldensis TaxID=3075516 RepID=A0ABU2X3G7_9ACTN|nr:ParA family protein [Micromonospora sp. DSM 115977]MDT0532166.1 ParA family protein [Micromonospora sp. DSM 115977]
MAIIAMVSAKGSPGVTTTALACTLSWSGRTVLAECDPAGGSVLSGYLSSLEVPPIGLLPLAAAALRDQLADAFAHQLVDLDAGSPGQRLVLPGINDPVQAGTIRPTWEQLTEFFADLERGEAGYNVIADCGRLATSAPPWPLLFRADLLLLVVRAAALRTIAPAAGVAGMLRRELTQYGQGPGALALALIGEGPYSRRDIEQRLQLPTVIELPDDRRTAEVLSDGGGRLRGSQRLLRAAASAESTVRAAIARRRAHLAPTASRESSRA